MENKYTNFDRVMDDLIKSTDISTFTAASLDVFAQHQDVFWDGLLQYLQNQDTKLGEYGIRQSMFPKDSTSIIKFINDNADLIDSFMDKCMSLSEPQTHWNESINKLIDIYKNRFMDGGEISDTNITLDNVKRANAGYDFDDMWVKPYSNIDGIGYDVARDNDKIIRILNDSKFLQFTQNNFHKYLKLLMPQYQRGVQVEDLNRNFWVIGQVLTGIMAFLFEEDSPFKDLFNNMLDEIAQLWQNLLYLWVGFALVSQSLEKNNTQVVVVPMANSEEQPYIKFDNFNTTTEEIYRSYWDRVKYLTNQYSKSTLIIIPEIRQKAYESNYFSKLYYPCAIIYNKRPLQGFEFLIDNNATDESIASNHEFIKFLPLIKATTTQSGTILDYLNFTIDLTSTKYIFDTDFSRNALWGVSEKSPYYHFVTDIHKEDYKNPNEVYVAAMRPVFSKPNFTIENGELKDFELIVECNDVVRELADVEPNVATISFSLANSDSLQYLAAVLEINPDKPTLINTSQPITHGWYRGEVVSTFDINEPSFTITLNNKWKNMGPNRPETTVIIKVTGEDSLGFTVDSQEFYFTSYRTDEGSTIEQTRTIKIPAYSASGEILNYNFTISELDEEKWEQTELNTKNININSSNKRVEFSNKWIYVQPEESTEDNSE